MNNFDQLMTEIEAQKGLISEIILIVATIHDHLLVSSNNNGITPAVQNQLDVTMETIKSNHGLLDAALEKINEAAKLTIEAPQKV